MNRKWKMSAAAFALILGCGVAFAQGGHQSKTVRPAHFDVSQPLSKMSHLSTQMQRVLHNSKANAAQISQMRRKLEQAGYLPKPGSVKQIPLYTKQPADTAVAPVRDPQVQRSMGGGAALAPNASTNPFSSPLLSFDGLGGSTGYIPNVLPPDPNAAVGFKYVVEIVNLAWGVFDKTTGAKVLGPIPNNALWAGFGGPCENDNDGDPIVMFDQLSQRWVISQFAIGTTRLTPPFYQCIAVSTSNDPTGSYYRYAYEISATQMNDYPKLGVWPDAYYYTANLFDPSTGAFQGVAFGAFDRAQMVAGNPYAPMIMFDVPESSGEGAYSVLPATLDGYSMPPSGAPGIFVDYISPRLWGANGYALQMWRMHVDWGTPSNSTLSGPSQIGVPAFNDLVCNNSRDCVPQPNGAPGLDAISDRLMYRLAYRNLGSKQALVVDQTVGVNNISPPTAMRWYQLSAPVAATSAWSLAQSGTYAPGVSTAGGASRWMGSIAMDHQGDIALGYSLSSTSIAPSIAYTGQVAGSPAGQMSEPETILKAGTGEQTSAAYRWGDYTSMATDPSNECTFWYTNEYYTSSGVADWSTHIGAFQFPSCTPQTLGTLSGTVTDASTGQPVQGANVVINPGDIVAQTNASGQYSMQLAAGSYTAQAVSYPSASASASVAIAAGQSQSQDFALQAASMVTVSGKVIDGGIGNGASAHGWGLYAELKVLVPNVGQVAQVFTDPVTGAYSVTVPKGFAYTLHVQAHSNYMPTEADLGTVSQDTTHNFTLIADAACNAPGYGDNFSEDFNGASFPPFGWAVTNAVSGSPVVWNTNVAWQDGNYTGGSGMAATADSNQAYLLDGYNGVYDTSLTSQPIAVSGLPTDPVLNFLLNYQEFSGNDALDVEINVDGTGWTTMAHITSDYGALYGGYYGNEGGASYTIDMSQYIPSGAKSIRLRWRYYDPAGGFDWYAQVDDVTIGTCRMLPGGLVVGQVSNLESQQPVVGARVYDELFDTTDSFATPNDPNFNDLYLLFVPTGAHTVMASGDSLYGSTSMNITANAVTRHDFPLGNADLMISSIKGGTVTRGSKGDVTDVVLSNQGPDTAVGVTLTVDSTGGLLHLASATSTQGNCSLSGGTGTEIVCNLGNIAADRNVAVNVSAYGLFVGQATVTVAAQAEDNDPNQSNNTGSATVSIQDPPKASSGSSGGGGFGAMGLLLLFALAVLGAGLRYRRRGHGTDPRKGPEGKEDAMSWRLRDENPKPRRNYASWALGVAIFLAVVLGVPGKPAVAATRAQGLMGVPAALASAVAKNEARTAAHEAAYHINARGCAGAAQSLKACFGPGATARFAAASNGAALRLRLSAWGRSGALAPVHLQAGRATGNRIAYRGAGIEAWWRALPIGYEQGFTVRRAPAGTGKLVLELKASAPAKVHDGVLSWGQVHYGKLYVTDAAGHRVPARLSAHGRTVLIRIADAGARYPLSVDPLVWVGQRVSQGDSVQFFGETVVVKGTTALIGSTAGPFVYTESSNGVWTESAHLVPTGPGAAPAGEVALNATGTVAVIADETATVGFFYAAGRAWVFTKSSNGTWTQTAALTANPPQFFGWFGSALAINAAGNEIVVGAVFSGQFYGSVYVFTESNGTWTQTQEFAPPTSLGRGGFGNSVAVDASGSTLLAGIPGAIVNGVDSQGAVMAYSYAGGSWSQGTMLTADNGQYYDEFGLVRLDAAGTRALIGAPDATVPGHNVGTGAAYIFNDVNGTWTQGQEISPDDGVQGASFAQGGSLAISADGNTVLVGSPHQNGSFVTNKNGVTFHQFAGAAYVFKDLNGTWSQTSELSVGSRPQDKYGLFGDSVSMSGNTMLIGAGSFNPLTSQRFGSAYFYSHPPSDLSLVLDAPAIVNASAQYTSQAILTNNSASASAPLTAIMPLPAGVGYVSATPTQGSCSQTSAAVTCNLGSVAGNGGSASVALTLQAPSSGQIKNQVTLADVSPAMNVIKNTSVGGSPSVSGLTNLQLGQSQKGTETFSVGGTGFLTLTVQSSDQTLLPDANITGAGSCTVANVCTLSVKPAAQQAGSADVTVTVTDSTGASASGSFTVTVAAPPAPSSGGSGGGGALGGLALAALLGLALAGARARRRA